MIEERSIAVAKCDACQHQDYANDQGAFPDSGGYTLTIVEHRTDTRHDAYACRETHIGKASRAVLEKWRNDTNQPWYDEGGTLRPADAPPLPATSGDEHGGAQ